jgi:chromosome partitioning protein
MTDDQVSRETEGRAVSRETPSAPGAPRPTLAADRETADHETPIAAAAAAAVRARREPKETFPRPPRRRVLAVANQKGGVGKTTTAVNLAAALALHGNRVLVVDMDPQGNASTALGIDQSRRSPGTYDVVLEECGLADVTQPSADVFGLFCAPASVDLAGAEVELVDQPRREFRLAAAIAALREPYDYVFVDCPPSLGLLTLNALCAAREVLIPIQCEYYALEGLGQLTSNVGLVAQHLNPGLAVSAILLTMYDGRTRLSEQVVDEVRAHFGTRVLSTTVPRSVRVAEAPSYGRSVVTYDPLSRGAAAYVDAARELATSVPEPPVSVDLRDDANAQAGQVQA